MVFNAFDLSHDNYIMLIETTTLFSLFRARSDASRRRRLQESCGYCITMHNLQAAPENVVTHCHIVIDRGR
jgi:hypothetical protein